MTVYWLFFVLTWISAASCFAWRARRHGVPAGAAADGFLFTLPGVLVGAHLASMFMGSGENLPWRTFLFTLEGWKVGYASYGAVAGAIAALCFAAWLHRLPALLLLDMTAPAVFVASIVGRVGCFLTGCCFGAPAEVPWAVRFALDDPIQRWTPASHPTQLYEIAASAVLLALLSPLARRLGARPGDGAWFGLGLGLFLAERFVIEWFRVGGTTPAVFQGLSKTHLVTLAGAFACALLVAGSSVRRRAAGTPVRTLPSRAAVTSCPGSAWR